MRVTGLGLVTLVLGSCPATAETPDPPCVDIEQWNTLLLSDRYRTAARMECHGFVECNPFIV